jgi:hypothetical protein
MDLGISPPSTQSRLDALRERAHAALGTAARGGAATRWAVTPALTALGVRLLIFMLADLGARLLPAGPFPGILRAWQHKDADWYLGIAQHGYLYSTAGHSSVNFFPLYPLLIWIVEPFVKLLTRPGAYLVAGMTISWVAFVGACVVLYKLVLDRFDQGAAYLSVLLLATFPFSLFYGAPYTESRFLLLTYSYASW